MTRLFVQGFRCKSRAVRVRTGNACPFPASSFLPLFFPLRKKEGGPEAHAGGARGTPAQPPLGRTGPSLTPSAQGCAAQDRAPWRPARSPVRPHMPAGRGHRPFSKITCAAPAGGVCRLPACCRLKTYTVKLLEYILII